MSLSSASSQFSLLSVQPLSVHLLSLFYDLRLTTRRLGWVTAEPSTLRYEPLLLGSSNNGSRLHLMGSLRTRDAPQHHNGAHREGFPSLGPWQLDTRCLGGQATSYSQCEVGTPALQQAAVYRTGYACCVEFPGASELILEGSSARHSAPRHTHACEGFRREL